MRRLALRCLTVWLGPIALVSAQTASPAPLSAFATVIDADVTTQAKLFVDAAEAMPVDRFDASPEQLGIPGSDFQGVRTFGEQVKHVAADNFAIWAAVAGEPEPPGTDAPNGPPEMKSRDDILDFLKASVEYSHRTVPSLTSENALQLVEFRKGQTTRISLVILALTHATTHYGHLAEYLRDYGVIPPASRPMSMPMPAQ